MNWKVILLGAPIYYVTVLILSFGTGLVIHDGILDEVYRATSEFWRPELNQDPPDMAALMPMWIFNGLIGAVAIAAVYSWIRPAFRGPAWQRGLTYGIVLSLIAATMQLGYSGVFNLPGKIWFWWTMEMTLLFLVGATVLAIAVEKLAPDS